MVRVVDRIAKVIAAIVTTYLYFVFLATWSNELWNYVIVLITAPIFFFFTEFREPKTNRQRKMRNVAGWIMFPALLVVTYQTWSQVLLGS